ncbi:MAG: ferredoxin family protein [Planctomycetaceae bacterium]|nr:ferredoxin family protein [Planctomycetaceae bacterium]
MNPGAPPRPPGEVHVIAERCKGCGWCVEFCPRGVLRESAAWNRRGYHPPEVSNGKAVDCAECHFCELLCPEFAIFVTKEAPAPAAAPGGPDRE